MWRSVFRGAGLVGARLVGVVAVVWLAAVPTAAGASTWSVEPTPTPSGALVSVLNGVSCTQAGPCTAVGFYQTSSAGYTLALRREGSGWRLQATPNPSGSSYTFLNGVSCVTPRTCTAVGNSTSSAGPGAPLAERWNGASWQVQATPNPAHPRGSSDLRGVSCPTPESCTAVGEYTVNPDTLLISTLAERWDGMRWQVQATPNPPGANFALLTGVSCARRTACTAVGGSIAEGWNGASWALEPVPSPPGAVSISLSGVSCAASNACTAVGTYNTATAVLTLAEHWNGSSWQLQPTPNPAGAASAALSGVSCPTARKCIAVGFYSTTTASFTLIERWNGAKWEIQPSPNVPGASSTTLNGVACIAHHGCTAVGTYSTGAGGFPLVERFSRRR